MTSPQPQPLPSDPGMSEGEQAALAALTTAILEAGLIGTVALPPLLHAMLLKLGLRPSAIKAATRLALADPLGRRRVHHSPGPRMVGTAAALTADLEAGYRAAYLLAAAKRITAALGLGADLFTALRAEHRYYGAHRQAGKKRAAAAHAVDKLAAQGWPWQMWMTRDDAKVERDCYGLHGTVFHRSHPPVVDGRPTYPGAAHLFCRCYPLPAPGPVLPGPTPFRR